MLFNPITLTMINVSDILIDRAVIESLRDSALRAPAGRILAVTYRNNVLDGKDDIRKLRNETGEVGLFFPFSVDPGRIALAPHGAGRDLTEPAQLLGVDIDETTYRIVSLEVEAVEAYVEPVDLSKLWE